MSDPIRMPVEATQIMLFARAIGDDNPAYTVMDDQMLAPPTFLESVQQFVPNYAFRPSPHRPWVGSSSVPTGVAVESGAEVTLHAEQHYEYHHPIRPGQTLIATSRPGETWTKEGSNGVLRFSEMILEFRDEAGMLMVTSRQVGVLLPGGPDE